MSPEQPHVLPQLCMILEDIDANVDRPNDGENHAPAFICAYCSYIFTNINIELYS